VSRALTFAAAVLVLAQALPAGAQGFEIAPFIGVRAGGADIVTTDGRPIAHDSTPAAGVIVDIPLQEGLQVEAAFSHQKTGSLTTNHFQGGGLQEYLGGTVRPFLTGILGLTQYNSGAGNEIRFTAGAGGGVKLLPSARVGLRLDGRLFATFLDAEGTALVCGGLSSACFIRLHVHVTWQAEFTAALVVRIR
jgi:hypothetical protein